MARVSRIDTSVNNFSIEQQVAGPVAWIHMPMVFQRRDNAVRISRRSALAVTAIGAIFTAVACSSSGGSGSLAETQSKGTLTNVSLVLPGQAGAAATIVYYGQQAGIFKKYGINLAISSPSSGSVTTNITYVQQGKYNIGVVDGPDALLTRQKDGGDVTVFYGYLQNNANCIMVPQNSSITSAAQLAGKTIAVPSTTNEGSIKGYLAASGVPASKTDFVALNFAALNASYISGKVDAAVSWAYNEPVFAAAGKPSRTLCPSDSGINYPLDDFVASAAWMKSHASVVRDFADAVTASIQSAIAHPDTAAVAAYKAEPAQKPKGADVPVQELNYITSKLLKTPNTQSMGYGWMSAKDWNITQQTAEKYFGLASGMNNTAVWTNAYLPKSS
jgi:NitT/TauT family transport system substrate-binding protein